jgi:hypothetical protein
LFSTQFLPADGLVSPSLATFRLKILKLNQPGFAGQTCHLGWTTFG